MLARDLAGGGRLTLDPGWLDAALATAFFEALRDGIAWRQESIRIAGKVIAQPRLTAWFGDPGAAYTYSGLRLEPAAWIPPLAELRRRAEATAGSPFNSVLCNLYRDGRDSMGFHADDERELGRDPVIASVSLGATRRFVLRPAHAGRGAERVELDLAHGSLLVMAGTTQHHFRHALPKQPGAGPRINLTFRRIVAA